MLFFSLSVFRLMVLFATFLSVAYSSPTIRTRCFIFGCDDPSPHDTHNGVSESTLGEFALFSQYAAAAYCEENNNSSGTKITCATKNCPDVEAANVTSHNEFENSPIADTTGFIAIDYTRKIVVLTFRGSVSGANWQENLKASRVHTDICHKCHVHKGFWQAWVEARPPVLGAVKTVMDLYANYRFVVTGHSLGGALATLAAGDIRKISTKFADITELYTYGSPRIGNIRTVDFLTKQSSLSHRITAVDDPVPRVPWHRAGYFHVSPEFWVHTNPQYPTTTDIMVVTGYYNKAGNSGANKGHTKYDMEAHRHYLGNITQCRPDKDISGSKSRRSF